MGSRHHKPNGCRCRRPRSRVCLRKGCGRQYTPKRWNQRYCQDAECLQLVRRWQAARRQAKRRQDDAVKSQHAEAQKARRRRAPPPSQPPKEPEVAAARGHAAKIFSAAPICDRPGCHEAPLKSGRSQAKYCCCSCRQAVRRVVDRERKWLKRGTFQGQRARDREYQAARDHRRRRPPDPTGSQSARASPK